jgi:hypothetical protein
MLLCCKLDGKLYTADTFVITGRMGLIEKCNEYGNPDNNGTIAEYKLTKEGEVVAMKYKKENQ